METIKSYLNAMFANLANTAEVKKAKSELLEMMEDKYNELKAEGKSENEAVATVIAEFGNLDELASELGLEKEVEETKEREEKTKARLLTKEEVMGYLASRTKSAWLVAIGVFLCITSVISPILSETRLGIYENAGVSFMFVFIAVAVALFITSAMKSSKWSYIKDETCKIDMTTTDYVKERKRSFETTNTICTSVGVMCFILSVVPAIIFDDDIITPSLLFLIVAIGVFLIVYVSIINGSYDTILNLNDEKTMSGEHARASSVTYTSKKAELILENYKVTVICIYLIISFLTFRWEITWIIFPIAYLINKILKLNFIDEED
ncbi:permease prefix domain 1-containing protein [Lachnospira multipara]|uniref:permease prefix domain 1-containing protein n=1 Tax=Lachnospira multipara TaxID=28051 RepID=UPI00048686AD|nr:permease prefix domain 1-containing protein [Lachnospira multipara]